MADSPQVQIEKLIKYANQKFGLNETTLRDILDNINTSPASQILGGEYNLESIIIEEDNTQKLVATKVTQPPNVIFTQQEDGSFHLEIVKAEG